MAPKRQIARKTNEVRDVANEEPRRSRSPPPVRQEEEDDRRGRPARRGTRQGRRQDPSAERRVRSPQRRGGRAAVDMREVDGQVNQEDAEQQAIRDDTDQLDEVQPEAVRDDTDDIVQVPPRQDQPIARRAARPVSPPANDCQEDQVPRRPLTRSQSAIHGGLVCPMRMKGPLGEVDWFKDWTYIRDTLQWARSEPAHQELMAKLKAKQDREQARRARAKEQYYENKRLRLEQQEEERKKKEYEEKKKAKEEKKKARDAAKKKENSKNCSKKSRK